MYPNKKDVSILFNICMPNVEKNNCWQHPPKHFAFSVDLLHRSSTQIVCLQLPANINLLLFTWHFRRSPLERTMQMCKDRWTWQAAEQWAETPNKALFKPQGSADSGDNSMKIYHWNWPLPLCSHCHYKCIDCSVFEAVRVCDNWTTVILAINYTS